MKKLLPLLLIGASTFSGWAQDIPLFSQKLTNSFMYNPAMAGHASGSLVTAYRTNYSGVAGAPTNYFLSFQTPIADGRFGAGMNLFKEKVNVLNNTYISGAFAYHLHIDRFNIISMGIGAEYNMMQFDQTQLTRSDVLSGDLVLQRYMNNTSKPDFSFGVLYQNRFLKAGIAANRLSTAWFQAKDQRVLSSYYSGYVQGLIPLRGEQDLLEPYFAFRKFSETNDTYDIGLFYTFNDKLILGGAMRAGSVLNATVGYKLNKNLLVGYSREMITGNVGGFVGSSSEFTLRLDFGRQATAKKFNSDYRSSLSYRRKTLNTTGVRKTAGGRTPKQLNRAQKRVSAYSPNKRYQNMSKLSGGRKSMAKKPTYKKRKSPARKSPSRRKRR